MYTQNIPNIQVNLNIPIIYILRFLSLVFVTFSPLLSVTEGNLSNAFQIQLKLKN
jgi:hypothetical protein